MGDLQHALAKALSLDAEIMIALADKDLVSRGPDMHMPRWRIFVFDKGKDILRRVATGIDAVSRQQRLA